MNTKINKVFDVHVTMHRVKFLIIKPTRCSSFSNLFLEWNSTCFGQFLCPSSWVFHCTHSNGICHTGLPTACSQAVSKPVWLIPLLCVEWKTPDDGQRNCLKHVEFHSKNKFEKLVHLVGFIITKLMRYLSWITCGLFGSLKYYFITKATEILCFPMDHQLVSYHPLRQLQKDDCVMTNSKATKWGSSRVINLNVFLLQTRKYERETARGGDPLGARGAGVGAESPLPLTASSPDTNNAEPLPCKVSPPGLSSSSLPDTGTNNMLSTWTWHVLMCQRVKMSGHLF